MAILKEIKENLRAISNIETITNAYQEIANLRMNKIRQRVLDNRDFIEKLSQIYVLAKKASAAERFKNKKTGKNSLKNRGKRLVVFLSSNERFYGTLILDIWKNILNHLTDFKSDLAVVGRMGKYLAESDGFGHKMFYFELEDDEPEKEKIKKIIDFLKNYEEVMVFHGRFQTVLFQKVVQSNVSGGFPEEKETATAKNYLFEPSPKAVLEFFETELISAFFNQAVLENQLSKYTTRMVAMYQASENAKEKKRNIEKEIKKTERQIFNKKQIELFSGYHLWGPLKSLN